MPALPPAFLDRPIAHRGLHDCTAGRPENSRSAVRAAIRQGYGIEIDLQLSSDGQAMVFHDYDLQRLTHETGPIAGRSARDLAQVTLRHGTEGIPTLKEILELVSGQVALLIEIKDQDGALGPNIGALERATIDALKTYSGDVAVMSFNPHSTAAVAQQCPDLPVGLVTCSFLKEKWDTIPELRLTELRNIPDYARSGSSFISHNVTDLTSAPVRDVMKMGANVLCWTVRSPQDELNARKIAQNVTFESYLA